MGVCRTDSRYVLAVRIVGNIIYVRIVGINGLLIINRTRTSLSVRQAHTYYPYGKHILLSVRQATLLPTIRTSSSRLDRGRPVGE
jgi:hypothetical protein